MIELFKMAIDKPLSAIVVAQCIITLTLHLGLFEVKTVIAGIQEQQEVDMRMNLRVLELSDGFARTDTNIEIIMSNQERMNLVFMNLVNRKLGESN